MLPKQVAGRKSVDTKRGMIVKMLVAAKGNEPGYIIRSLQVRGNHQGNVSGACGKHSGRNPSDGERVRMEVSCRTVGVPRKR